MQGQPFLFTIDLRMGDVMEWSPPVVTGMIPDEDMFWKIASISCRVYSRLYSIRKGTSPTSTTLCVVHHAGMMVVVTHGP